MQEQSTAVQASTAASIKMLKKCATKRARAETRKRVKEKQKKQQVKKKSNIKTRVPYTKHQRNNALSAIIESYFDKTKYPRPMSIRKAAALYLDDKYSTLQRCINKFKVVKKIKAMIKYIHCYLFVCVLFVTSPYVCIHAYMCKH